MIAVEFEQMMLSQTGDYKTFADRHGWDTYINLMESWNRKENPRHV